MGWTEFTRPAPRVLSPESRRIPVRENIVRPPDDDTRALGWLGWSPAWAVGVLLLLGILSVASSMAAVLVPLAFALIAVALVALAQRDRTELRRRGLPAAPNLAWIALGPVGYLAARRHVVGGRSGVHLALCITSLVVIAGGLFLWQSIALGLGALGELLGDADFDAP